MITSATRTDLLSVLLVTVLTCLLVLFLTVSLFVLHVYYHFKMIFNLVILSKYIYVSVALYFTVCALTCTYSEFTLESTG